ncbi:RICIN domain-containing protein [Streptomyces sp. NBC_00424]|uniref:RICIN domain-containing protein n=1 Tax=Streptomyces sp. NBC_00424 TaxID=2903648 RepID=UPI00225502DD|nr:RICIN domain-containing protein [Streptomyces sp. NBC_00424]MCX5078507.1 RICIN domain-containing protein [Streptomyces sp. NBC_00424]
MTLVSGLPGGQGLALNTGAEPNQQVAVDSAWTGRNRLWRLSVNQADATFEISDRASGKCIGLLGAADGYDLLAPSNCKGTASQRWYFNPGPRYKFMIRNVASGKCLTVFGGEMRTPTPGQPVVAAKCQPTGSQLWGVGSDPHAAVWDLAIDHAAKACQATPGSCSWNSESEAPAAPLPISCKSEIWYNGTSAPLDHTFSVTKTTGYSNEMGSELETGFETGAVTSLIAKVTAKLKISFKAVWSNSQATADVTRFSVPPGQYGWVELATVAQKVTGTWTFDLDGIYPWTVRDTIAIPLTTSNGLSTVYSARASATVPDCHS